MNDNTLVVGLDCSTHATKAIAWDLKGTPVFEAHAGYSLLLPHAGHYEQRAQDWLKAAIEVLAAMGKAGGARVRAIGITSQRETFVGVDDWGDPVRDAIVWMDERAVEFVQRLRDTIGEERFRNITGKPLSLTPSISKILWLREHEPESFARTARWLDVQAFLARKLTGADFTSIGSADPMGLLDIEAGLWSEVLLDACGISQAQLPSLRPPGTVCGNLLPEVAAATGLDVRTPVVLTAGDGQVAALGAQIFGLDQAYMNLGTAVVAGTVSPEPRRDPAFRTMSGAVPSTFLLESDLKGGTLTIDWYCDALLGGAASPARLEREAARLAPGADGLVLVPYFAAAMNPYWDDDASGIVVGWRAGHGRAHVYRAILEGIALEQRLCLHAIEQATGTRIAEVRVLGGGSTSALWCQILADVLERPIVRTRSSEATSLGAAMLAVVGAGIVADLQEASRTMAGTAERFEPGEQAVRYRELFDDVFVHLYPSLRQVLGRLAAFARRSRA